ncbi:MULTISPECIES: SDR family NAD(P)-dependent oxidoreductase [unclassified Methylophaga]|uniref:SDR family NAD(P)-dependent oxidoreductase n=1 Tax=unclassified Methylophaga TaxID=2629249 RepID=UPI000C8D3F77|nr:MULTISPECIES: SDR family NAD(P)-dependent oxidoreductase [unclassified Methylophaga]MBN47036.1 short-chain dehydrogenase [Methylophaga sp.]|tara:strand:- start:76227 stop:76883 length:657 start_codon:yes stop_codon:yes gene_type:complete
MKTLLIIGAGPGISQSTANRFAQEGFRILLAGRDESNASDFIAALRKDKKEAEYYHVDATDASQVNELIDQAESKYGQIDVLHYNAANLRNQTIEQQPADSFVADLNVNIAGALVSVKKAFEYMKSRQTGTILLTGGGFALQPHPEYLSLSIGKAGIRAISQGLFETFKAENVHIASVTVATFVTPESEESEGIADSFWQLHLQPKDNWTDEIVYPSN